MDITKLERLILLSGLMFFLSLSLIPSSQGILVEINNKNTEINLTEVQSKGPSINNTKDYDLKVVFLGFTEDRLDAELLEDIFIKKHREFFNLIKV